MSRVGRPALRGSFLGTLLRLWNPVMRRIPRVARPLATEPMVRGPCLDRPQIGPALFHASCVHPRGHDGLGHHGRSLVAEPDRRCSGPDQGRGPVARRARDARHRPRVLVRHARAAVPRAPVVPVAVRHPRRPSRRRRSAGARPGSAVRPCARADRSRRAVTRRRNTCRSPIATFHPPGAGQLPRSRSRHGCASR